MGCGGINNVEPILKRLWNKDDIFIVDIDIVLENSFIAPYIGNIQSIARKYSNVYVLDTICFEDTMLRFRYLKEWLFSSCGRKTHSISNKIKYIDEYRKFGTNWRSSSLLSKLSKGRKSYSTENIAYDILFMLTHGTGLAVSKSEMGICYKNTCKQLDCHYMQRNFKMVPLDKRCGLWELQKAKTSREKALALYRHTIIGNELSNCKRYFLQIVYRLAQNIV